MARIVPLPGSAIPSASQRQFIELAVNIPLQLPQGGQPAISSSSRRASLIAPDARAPTASNTEIRSTFCPPRSTPAAIGPPETKIVGMFTRAAPINIPGTILSQLRLQTLE